jgi:outer membrane immunogenic protein
MKKLAVAIAALGIAAASAPAFAADMALKAPPPRDPGYNWTGWYAGLNAGYSWGRSATNFTVAGLGPFSTSQSMNGGLGGGQIGYNSQVNGNWLVGLEADIQGTGQRGTANLPVVVFVPAPGAVALPNTTSTGTFGQKLPWFGTLRGRLGLLASPTWLFYVTGGLAFGEVKSTASVATSTAFPGGPVLATAAATGSTNTTRAGWTVGGGVEGVISGQWTAKLEYLYVDLGTFTNNFVGVGPTFPAIATSSHVTDNILRVGVNYHFH